jgi:hypothetical protein
MKCTPPSCASPSRPEITTTSLPTVKIWSLFAIAVLASINTSPTVLAATNAATVVDVRKIWDKAPHNAFTDLIHFQDRWFCVFREGRAHVSPDGAVRILTSKDGREWESAALLTSTNSDLRDAKITTTPDGRLMLTAAGALHPPANAKHQSLVWFSKQGTHWAGPHRVADPNQWLWRVTWHRDRAYGVAYDTAGEKFVRLYSSGDGTNFSALVPNLLDQQSPNESALVFLPDDRAVCLLRRDGTPGHGLFGTARPPYTDWEWKDVGMKVGGPALLRLPDGRLVAGGRLYDGKVRTSLLWMDPEKGVGREFVALPSGGDCSYPGLVWREGLLWVSYYSSHEGKAAIYLARVELNGVSR